MNRLAGESSPYLLQHAENPVDWYPWGEEAFARARAEGIDCFVMDVHMSVLEGGIGLFPRRLSVRDKDAFLARAILRDNEVEDLVEE